MLMVRELLAPNPVSVWLVPRLGAGLVDTMACMGYFWIRCQVLKIVTAAGDLVTASTEENSDLFWGIRGAGFNFGTILEATYSVYNETAPQVLNADFLFASNATQRILEYFKSYESNLPAEWSFILLAAYSSDFGGVSSFTVNRGLLLLHWLKTCIRFSHL